MSDYLWISTRRFDCVHVPAARRGANLLHLVSDDVMLEHIIPHLSDFDLFCNFSATNKELHELCKSDLFWKLQIKYRMRKASVDALQHITNGCGNNEMKFVKLYSAHKFVCEPDRRFITRKSQIELLLRLIDGKREDSINIELLMKRQYALYMHTEYNYVSIYYYTYDPFKRCFDYETDENGCKVDYHKLQVEQIRNRGRCSIYNMRQ